MTRGFLFWFRERSLRERILLSVMGGLFGVVILWLGIAMPVDRALVTARQDASVALERNAAIRTKVAALRQLPRTDATPIADLSQLVGQSAGEAGFTLERNQPQGRERVDIAIATARPTALLGWIAALEAQGVTVDSLTMRPAAVTGTVSVQAVLKGRGQ